MKIIKKNFLEIANCENMRKKLVFFFLRKKMSLIIVEIKIKFEIKKKCHFFLHHLFWLMLRMTLFISHKNFFSWDDDDVGGK